MGAAELVDKILRGTKPSDIPVEQPNKFELVINLTTAKAFGLTMSRVVFAACQGDRIAALLLRLLTAGVGTSLQ